MGNLSKYHQSNPDYGAIKFQLNHSHNIMLLQENYIHSSSNYMC